ncbi:MAG: transglutaminase-like domain-containing protein [Candidatus Brocadiales bacterium]
MRTFYIVAALLPALLWGCAGGPAVEVSKSNPTRAKRVLEFFYSAEITNVPRDARDVQIWVPIPQSDENQEISCVEIRTLEDYDLYTGPLYGNKICHIHVKGAPQLNIPISLRFLVTRYEDHGGDYPVSPAEMVDQFLKPSRRGAIIPEVEEAATRIGQRQDEPQGRIREVYQYVIDNMEYKKEGTGWGHGDTVWACSARYGNCTDYHALFIALSQALGVPAHFDMGFPLPPDKSEGTIGGYHCWAHFYLSEMGWVPVDVSEADKRPALKNYFFGSHDPNRVKFTTGRDIILEPRQKGEPLNYFIYPYAEVDGIPHREMTLSFKFRDL